MWPELPAHIDAAYENTNHNSMLVFKGEALIAQHHHKELFHLKLVVPFHVVSHTGSQYWEVSSLKVKHGYPRNISEFTFPSTVRRIDAALHFRETRLTDFFIGGECWRYKKLN